MEQKGAEMRTAEDSYAKESFARRLWQLFCIFGKIGLFTFGGGYAMIALIEAACIEQKKWLSKEEFLELIALAESTPGPIAVNTATYIGYKLAGYTGATVATAGVVGPAFVIMYILTHVWEKAAQNEIWNHAFRGIQVAVALIIARAGLRLVKAVVKVEKGNQKLVIGGLAALGAVTALSLSLLGIRISLLWFCGFGILAGALFCRPKRLQGPKQGESET